MPQLPELNELNVSRSCEAGDVNIRNGTFSWGDKVTLTDVNVSFPRGKLTIVVGQVGSGESRFLLFELVLT